MWPLQCNSLGEFHLILQTGETLPDSRLLLQMIYIFIDLPVHSLTKLTSWNSNWNQKKVLYTQKIVTCTVMTSWHRVLHLCVALKINSKQRTELKTANSGGIFFPTSVWIFYLRKNCTWTFFADMNSSTTIVYLYNIFPISACSNFCDQCSEPGKCNSDQCNDDYHPYDSSTEACGGTYQHSAYLFNHNLSSFNLAAYSAFSVTLSSEIDSFEILKNLESLGGIILKFKGRLAWNPSNAGIRFSLLIFRLFP